MHCHPPKYTRTSSLSLARASQNRTGIVLAGTHCRSGELLLTTGLGAKHGFVFLWLILFSCVSSLCSSRIGTFMRSLPENLRSVRCKRSASSGCPAPGFSVVVRHVALHRFSTGGMTGSIGQALNLAFPRNLPMDAQSSQPRFRPALRHIFKSDASFLGPSYLLGHRCTHLSR